MVLNNAFIKIEIKSYTSQGISVREMPAGDILAFHYKLLWTSVSDPKALWWCFKGTLGSLM